MFHCSRFCAMMRPAVSLRDLRERAQQGGTTWRPAARACGRSCQPFHCLQVSSGQRLHAAPHPPPPLACLEDARPVLAWLPSDSGLPGCRDRSQLTAHTATSLYQGSLVMRTGRPRFLQWGGSPASSSRNERALAMNTDGK